ncbi:MAG: response regulator [Candidatus Paceibacterota bacterium]|jgi:two-component system response regulator VicR
MDLEIQSIIISKQYKHMNNPKKVMIVEDDVHVAKVYNMELTQKGFETILAVDGEEAIAKITSEVPDLIILDLMLPKKDGFAVLEEIKKNPILAKIPVIVLSNLGQDSDKMRAEELGVNEYLIKVQHSIQEVVEKVESYLVK